MRRGEQPPWIVPEGLWQRIEPLLPSQRRGTRGSGSGKRMLDRQVLFRDRRRRYSVVVLAVRRQPQRRDRTRALLEAYRQFRVVAAGQVNDPTNSTATVPTTTTKYRKKVRGQVHPATHRSLRPTPRLRTGQVRWVIERTTA